MTKAQEVGKRIAQARREMAVRERRDVRPADVAREVGVSGATVSDWEAGKIVPRDDAMAKLAKFLGVTPAYLRYGVIEAGTEQPIVTFRIPDSMAETFSQAQRAAAESTPPTDAHEPEPPRKVVGGGRPSPKRPKGRR